MKIEKVEKTNAPNYPGEDAFKDNPELLYANSPSSWKNKALVAGTLFALTMGGCVSDKPGQSQTTVNTPPSPRVTIDNTGITPGSPVRTMIPPTVTPRSTPQPASTPAASPQPSVVISGTPYPTITPPTIRGEVAPSSYKTEQDAAKELRKK